jgi:hypothetical protein
MRVVLLSSCAQIGNTLGDLGEHLGGAEIPWHRRWQKCSTERDPIKLSSEVRGLINGSQRVVVGINRDEREASMRTLHVASHSHHCVVMMTLEGYRGFFDYFDALPPHDRDIFLSRIVGVVMIGDVESCFRRIPSVLVDVPRRHIGGLQWSSQTCVEMARFVSCEVGPKPN